MTGITSVSATAAAALPEAKKAAQQFEAVFLRQLLAEVHKGKLADDIFGSDSSDRMRELADAQTADTLAARGAFGIAQLIEQQLSKGK